MLIPAPRLPEIDGNKCTEKGCDGFYQPYRDGSLSCYQGHLSSLSVDDVEIEGWALVPALEEC
jgi:hypothetical protein